MTLPGLVERGRAVGELPGLGLLTLAGMLPEGWTSNYQSHDGNSESLVEKVLQEKPSLVAVSALTASIEDAYGFSRQIQKAGVPVVIGGLHATACHDEARQYCDAVVVGEGESVWLQLLSDCETDGLKPIYSSFETNATAPWPIPRFDILPSTPPRFTLQTQRGCPLACDFCGASRLLGAFREKPDENVRRELESIRAVSANPIVELADDNTFVGGRCIDDLFGIFADADIRYFTEADWRIGSRPELLRGLARSGCVQILVGMESLVFRYPGMGQKSAEQESVLAAIEAIQDSGVAVNACFIVGAEGETRESIDRLVSFILEGPFADVQVTLQTPFPGTGLYKRLKREKRILEERAWSSYTLFDVTFQPDQLSVSELEAAFAEAVGEIYSAEATSRRKAIRKQVWKRNPVLAAGEQR
ncbi:radical SAM protein [Pirellulales bacterium]|nr:radical SAM protein [Pirellulales bacterium]